MMICSNYFRGELVKEILTEGTKLVQEIANKLFNFPSTETNDGPIVQLPPPTTKLPREKHVRSSFLFSTISILMQHMDLTSFKCKRVISCMSLSKRLEQVHIFAHHLSLYCTKACNLLLFSQIPRPKPPTKWEEFALKKGKSCLRNCFKDWKLYFVQILMGRRPLCSIV